MFQRFLSALMALVLFACPAHTWAQWAPFEGTPSAHKLKGAQARQTDFDGRVVAVLDGDTVTVLDEDKRQHRIRLLGIDAPEKAQPFGQRAKQQLSGLVYAKEVHCVCVGVDRYERSLCTIFTEGNVDANLAMVVAGLAWHNRPYQRSQSLKDRLAYASAQRQAQSEHLGLWRDDAPVPPWDYRRAQRQHDQ